MNKVIDVNKYENSVLADNDVLYPFYESDEYITGYCDGVRYAVESLKAMVKDTDFERHGKWKYVSPHTGNLFNYMCSECKRMTFSTLAMPNYCPHCGARMDLKDE